MNNFSDKVSFLWSVADLLRGPYRPNQYGRVILPLTVLRRLDCVLEPTKDKVLKKVEGLAGGKVGNVDPILNRAAGVPFHNTSKLTFARLKDDPGKIARNLASYIKCFSGNVRAIFERFAFEEHITKLDEHDRLFLVVSKFCDIDLHPEVVPNIEMGYIFEELVRRFSEAANETAGDHFTPREVIRLMVNLLFQPDSDILTRKGIVKTMLDPTCGTGGILAVSDEYLRELNPDARLEVFGQDYNPESYAVYFAPAHGMNPDNQRLYAANRLTVTRQLHYSEREPAKSLDVVLALNGIPVATAELKNPLTGQTVVHARHQYMNDRDPREKIFEFKQRALVHFAVDPDEVYMATKLAGQSTVFLPFNRGHNHGAGNPPNPHGYKTAYLWEEVWERDSLLDILARFIHLQVEEKQVEGKKVRRETMVFPRYHQLDSVRRLEGHARSAGAGNNYLIQHSAGSGKSNSIAWLAHRLASLHDAQDQKVFDSVVVITDRVVLDRQLQDTIYQFEHKQGVVQKIDENSTQLADALQSGVPIIITTLQKFPFVTDKVESLPNRRYAVIVDEAHSSQSGEAAMELKGVLSANQIRDKARQEAEEQGLAAEHEEMLLREMAKRGRQPNLSFFAFTATPKYKTLEVFGVPGASGKPEPFHLYSMRQAIQERFILDVLAHYTTYQTYFRLIKAIEDDPRVEKRKAARALARFMSLHPHNIAQKVEVMLEHFHTHTRHKIGGRAKAMVVTGSRLHAVRYKQEFDKQIKEKGYDDIRTLVAFSGTVPDPDVQDLSYTEPGMNIDLRTGKPIGEKELPARFGEADYQVLIVADKYQTGFDQPLLHTMYVDKRLAGVQAVQTLSRLNRMCAGKDDTFVLDFYNEAQEIEDAFQPYYERTTVGEQADPGQLNELYDKIMDCQIIWREEVDKLCAAFFRDKPSRGKDDHSRLYVHTDPAVGRFKAIPDEASREEFRGHVTTFRNLYAFLAQIIPFGDSDLEKLYTYLRFFIRRLPRPDRGPNYDFDDEVTLKFYKLQKKSEGAIALDGGTDYALDGPTEVGTGQPRGPEIELSKLIDLLNERFGTEFKAADQLFFDQINEAAAENPELRQAALANPIDAFKFVFDKALEALFIDRMEQNAEITAKFLNDANFQQAVTSHLRETVYERIRAEADGDTSA